jgi:hypothetical protein
VKKQRWMISYYNFEARYFSKIEENALFLLNSCAEKSNLGFKRLFIKQIIKIRSKGQQSPGNLVPLYLGIKRKARNF